MGTTKKATKKKDKDEYEVSDIESELESSEEDDGDEKSETERPDFTSLIKQANSEWEQGWWFMKPKWDEWSLRLKLFNNQKRDKESVGDTTMFAVFQTVLPDYRDWETDRKSTRLNSSH